MSNWTTVCFTEVFIFINMIWVFKEHLVSSESVNYTWMWIIGGCIYPGLGLWAPLMEKAGFLRFPSCIVSCGHCSALCLFCLIPALQHWWLSHQRVNLLPQTRARQAALHQHNFLSKEQQRPPAEHSYKPKRCRISTATIRTKGQSGRKGPGQPKWAARRSCSGRTSRPRQEWVCSPLWAANL